MCLWVVFVVNVGLGFALALRILCKLHAIYKYTLSRWQPNHFIIPPIKLITVVRSVVWCNGYAKTCVFTSKLERFFFCIALLSHHKPNWWWQIECGEWEKKKWFITFTFYCRLDNIGQSLRTFFIFINFQLILISKHNKHRMLEVQKLLSCPLSFQAKSETKNNFFPNCVKRKV